jgi:hypothetical protein
MTPRARKWTTAAAAALAVLAGVGVWRLFAPGPDEPSPAPVEGGAGGRGRASATAPPRAAASRVPAHAELSPLDEARGLVQSQPERALRLLSEGVAADPDSADERSFLKMRAWVNLDQIAAARDEAAAFFQRFPQSPYAPRVTELTGVHPRPPVGPRPH